MDGFVAAGAPACAAREEIASAALMEEVADRDTSGGLLLEMAFKTQVGIARGQHFLIHAAMRVVAGSATFTEGFMLKNVRPPLRRVAMQACIVRGRLRGRAAFDRPAFVRIMAVAATHFSLFQRMTIREAETATLIQVALIARLGIAPGIDDRMGETARLIVKTPRSVAGFATHVLGVWAMRH